MAVKVTLEVAQTEVDAVVMFTDGVRIGLTVIVILLLVAGLPVAQGVAFDVRITLTTSLLFKVELE